MSRPKLIEVALPLAAINREAVREKSIRHGHPSTLHLLGVDHRPPAEAEAAQRLAGGGQPLAAEPPPL